ncbi:MAG TPA: hypothetical protein VMU57_15895 [Edaphobacter sp.]|nr:hypothetical protein [Edaphobacter sp.]HUZ96386.1 hypothetical protein [Edaphobacter sp.]
MKYTAPAVLNAINATKLIQGGKGNAGQDSSNPLERTNGAGYGADE